VWALCKFCEDFAQINGLTTENEFVGVYVVSELVKYDLRKDKKIE
jgi:hypothetical protein